MMDQGVLYWTRHITAVRHVEHETDMPAAIRIEAM
jgi:hypothetical protein